MPLPVPYDQADDMTGNGKKTKAALLSGAVLAAAMLAASASDNQRKADASMERAALNQQKAQDALAGKGKSRKTVYDMYGDKRGGVDFTEKLLWSPNSNSAANANF